jgi:hypothetical protein
MVERSATGGTNSFASAFRGRLNVRIAVMPRKITEVLGEFAPGESRCSGGTSWRETRES